jgi:hypothetical protein
VTTATPTRARHVTRSCLVCGDAFTFSNPHGDKARVTHNCPTNACGPVWVVYGPVIR